MSFKLDQTLYHNIDTRMNLYELENLPPHEKAALYPDLEKIKANALAVACLIMTNEIIETPLNYQLSVNVRNLSERVSNMRIIEEKPERFNAPLAENEKFRTEPAPGFGTGFLVKRGKILTAGHCVCDKTTSQLVSQAELDKIRIVFRYHKTDPNTNKTTFAKADVYKIKKVISHSYKYQDYKIPDWALIKLDRKVEGINPIEVDFSATLDHEAYALGCPTGMAVKCSSIGYATIKIVTQDIIQCNADALGGNSGCPIIDRKINKAIAIYVRGYKHYVFDEDHLKRTGEKRVISLRVTPSMVVKGWEYGDSQRIKPEMVDIHAIAAKRGREERKLLSDRHSKANVDFINKELEEQFDHRKTAIALIISGLAIITLPIALSGLLGLGQINDEIEKLRHKLKIMDDQRKSLGYKVNEREASCFYKISNHQIPLDEKIEIAKHMSAYYTSEAQSIAIRNLEVNVFHERFSPGMIKDLLQYQLERNVQLTVTAQKRILKYLHNKILENDKLNNYPLYGRVAIIDARIKGSAIKHLTKDLGYGRYYSNADIERIARCYVIHPKMTIEEARKSLGLPDPNP